MFFFTLIYTIVFSIKYKCCPIKHAHIYAQFGFESNQFVLLLGAVCNCFNGLAIETSIVPTFLISQVDATQFIVEFSRWIPIQNMKLKPIAICFLRMFGYRSEQQSSNTFHSIGWSHVQIFQEAGSPFPCRVSVETQCVTNYS